MIQMASMVFLEGYVKLAGEMYPDKIEKSDKKV